MKNVSNVTPRKPLTPGHLPQSVLKGAIRRASNSGSSGLGLEINASAPAPDDIVEDESGYVHYQSGSDRSYYVTFQDIIAISLKILLNKRGVTMEQLTQVTKLSPNTLNAILNCSGKSHLSLNLLYTIQMSVLRIPFHAMDQILFLAESVLKINANTQVSEYRKSLNAHHLHPHDLERFLTKSLVIWAVNEKYLTVEALAA